MIRPHRQHPLWLAFMLHRLSGVALALFLPAHFYLLSLALTDPRRMDELLSFAEHPAVKIAEFGLVFLLAAHLFGGLRLLALEFLPMPPAQKTLAAATIAGAFLIAGSFLLRAI